MDSKEFSPTEKTINRLSETSITFCSFEDFRSLLKVQNPENTYKAFLGEYFGTRVKNASAIKCKICDAQMPDVKADFMRLQKLQGKKPFTILRRHIVGFPHVLEQYPYIIEYEVKKSDQPSHCIIINNSITYYNERGICFKNDSYAVTNSRNITANRLPEILEAYKGYQFTIHIITPKPHYTNFGKTEIDISDVIHVFIDHIRKTLNRIKRVGTPIRVRSKKDRALENMDEAFSLASTGGIYGITARQMYYKLRELIGDTEWETDSTYASFTQDWITQWIDEHPEKNYKMLFVLAFAI